MFIFSNLATSLDGKIATESREHFPLGTPADRKLMLKLRAQADAVLQGAGTLRVYRRPLLCGPASDPALQPINVVISSMLEGVSPRWRYFTSRRTRKVLFVSHRAPEKRVREFAAAMGRSGQVFRLKSRKSQPVARQIVRRLEKLGVRRLLLEGGGGLMWDFAEPNLIDEMHVTLTPRILGGSHAPTLVDGAGFSPRKSLNLKLKGCRRLGNELYLVYGRTSRRGP